MEVTGASPSTHMRMSNSFTATLDPMAGPGPSPTTGTNNLPPRTSTESNLNYNEHQYISYQLVDEKCLCPESPQYNITAANNTQAQVMLLYIF